MSAGPSVTVATSARRTALPPKLPTTRLATSSAERKKVPVSTKNCWLPLAKLPDGKFWFCICRAGSTERVVMFRAAMRCGSSSTRTLRRRPPINSMAETSVIAAISPLTSAAI